MSGNNARPLDLYWYLPTHGDGPYLGTDERHRPATFGYLKEIAQAADRLGFKGVLLPTGTRCEDAWIVAAGLIPLTERLKFLVALRPGSGTPALFARHAATLDRISGGRVLLNVVTGADPADLAGDGNKLAHDERYAQTDEFLTIWRRILSGEGRFRGQVPLGARHRHLFPAHSATASAALVRRLFRCRHRDRRQACGRLSELGRTGGPARRKNRSREKGGGGARPHDPLRPAHPFDRARNRGRGLGRRRPADQPCHRRPDRRSPERLRQHLGIGWAEAYVGFASGPARQAGHRSESVGRARAGARRRRNRARRQSRQCRGANPRVSGDRHRNDHRVRLPASGRGLQRRRTAFPQTRAERGIRPGGTQLGRRVRTRHPPEGRRVRPVTFFTRQARKMARAVEVQAAHCRACAHLPE
ncbi:hypothetical protein MPL3365_70578 [Mesorhizobium plurifarium]|uniref:Luciferase-like domain-containing protein n=1 Tax=Mesorhizobium plurifarium TaxID=69974 RepID=A0A090GW81_MESPL|nr:hypothetical protein MPL3365_70578 [Mesorhizobium plurifarium]